jgi:hypothetical protein
MLTVNERDPGLGSETRNSIRVVDMVEPVAGCR